ncbi:hypothetical protein [Scytonema sp. UIC 10036]|nr:hypothetical protein [Scytonema sp. UIC 10036]
MADQTYTRNFPILESTLSATRVSDRHKLPEKLSWQIRLGGSLAK